MGKENKEKRAPPARVVPTETKPEEASNTKIGDTPTTKGLVDDTVIKAFTDFGIPEDLRMSNLKLFLGFVAVSLALLAQFWPHPRTPMPFPQAKPLYIFCTVIYFTISGVLTLLATFYEKETIMFTRSCPKVKTPLRVNTRLPRFSADFHVSVCRKDNDKELISKTFALTEYFEEDGKFHPDFLLEDMAVFLKSLKLD
mmetsp:Transcript_22997/g.53741  ORF Transcript_22997/g.53741 Transcript_22997/m.53741 type:complete len:198 (-) Transcript_22997:47-640(-)